MKSTVYPIIPHYIDDKDVQDKDKTSPSSGNGSNNYLVNETTQQLLNDVLKSLDEIKAGLGFNWYDTVKITSEIINNRNIINLPNNRLFGDLDSKSLLIFVNDIYIPPEKYIILNKTSFYFKSTVSLNPGDIVHIIYFDKKNKISNYDSLDMAIATSWRYTYQNETNEALDRITLDNKYSFSNPDKYSLLVYINDTFIHSREYEIPNTRELVFNNHLELQIGQTITIIQLGQILPNEEYVGFVWGESIDVEEDGTVFHLSEKHAFANRHDNSALVFVDDKIRSDYKILNTTTFQFSETISAGSHIEIIQLGYITDIAKIKDLLDITTIKNLLDIDSYRFVKEDSCDKVNGYAGIHEDGFISSNVLNLETLSSQIRDKFVDNGWLPADSQITNHLHSNLDVLAKLQMYKGKLYCDGYPVGERATEAQMDIVVTDRILEDGGFVIPNDCDSDRPITLVLNSISILHDNEWQLIENDYPDLDFISWRGKPLEEDIELDDVITITYYKLIDKIEPPLPPSDTGYSHTHSNYNLLEALHINGLHELCINGVPVIEAAIETDQDYVITQQDIDNKYLELPQDCDDTRPVVVVLQGVTLMRGIDYCLVYYDEPEKDRISWDGYGLDDLISEDDHICVTYYRKT